MKYRIYKQLLPHKFNPNDPIWSKRQIWVQKLNENDTVDEFDTLEEAESYQQILEQHDPTDRVYMIKEVE
jgi:hypothetical protein